MNNQRCDVAVVGAGPVGMMTACMIKAFHPNLTIKIFDKRTSTTRDHGLYIAKDGIGKIGAVFKEQLKCLPSANGSAAKELNALIKKWEKRTVRTSRIEETLTTFARERLGIEVLRDPQQEVTADSFLQFLDKTQARVVIGADGSKSQVRHAIGAEKLEEKPLGYLIELKYSTSPHVSPRGKLIGSYEASLAEGWDFETIGRAQPDETSKRISLHKFCNEETHRSLLMQQGDVIKGGNENPWTMEELSQRAKTDDNVRWIYDHIQRYFSDHDFQKEDYWEERILTFPMTLYRSSFVARKIGKHVALLAGDASAGVVLARGVNKGFIEAALCAKAVSAYFEELLPQGKEILRSGKGRQVPCRSQIDSSPELPVQRLPSEESNHLPEEFENYEKETHALYQGEKSWAEWKHFGLTSSEFLLKCLVRPLKWIVSAAKSLAMNVFKKDSKTRTFAETSL